MERLEAALEKARKTRKSVNIAAATTQDSVGVIPVQPQEDAPAPDLWASLTGFKISNSNARKQRITALNNTKQAGPYDLLRSRTLRLMRENNWKSIAITSPNAHCGKTTVCANLALSLGRQSDLRILVLDLDLRRPTLHKVLSHRPAHSFHEVLSGEIAAKDQFVRYGDNLAFGLNNKPATTPSEILQSNQTRTRLQAMYQEFEPDVVLFDMPPMLATDDNVGFLPNVDCGLLVSAADSTSVTQLDICEKELSELTNVVGVVLNKCRFADDEQGYDYDYY